MTLVYSCSSVFMSNILDFATLVLRLIYSNIGSIHGYEFKFNRPDLEVHPNIQVRAATIIPWNRFSVSDCRMYAKCNHF